MKKLWAFIQPLVVRGAGFIRHNQGMFISSIIAVAVLLWTYGCHSQVTSIVNPTVLVNRAELQIEVDNFIARAELKFQDLDRQDEVKSTLFNVAIDFMRGGKINPVAVAMVIGQILGLGAIVDNVKKRTHINTLKGKVTNEQIDKETKAKVSNIEAGTEAT